MIDIKRHVLDAGPEGRIVLDAVKDHPMCGDLIDFTMIPHPYNSATISMYCENIDELIEKLQELRAWQKND